MRGVNTIRTSVTSVTVMLGKRFLDSGIRHHICCDPLRLLGRGSQGCGGAPCSGEIGGCARLGLEAAGLAPRALVGMRGEEAATRQGVISDGCEGRFRGRMKLW